MDWSPHTHAQEILKGYLWVTCCPFNLCNGAILYSIISSNDVTPAVATAWWWSHRECRSQTDDLGDDLQLCLSICNLIINIPHSLSFQIGNQPNQKTGIATDAGMRQYICMRLCELLRVGLLQSFRGSKHIEGFWGTDIGEEALSSQYNSCWNQLFCSFISLHKYGLTARKGSGIFTVLRTRMKSSFRKQTSLCAEIRFSQSNVLESILRAYTKSSFIIHSALSLCSRP